MVELKTLNEIDQEFSFTGKEVREIGLKFSDMNKIGFAQDQRDKTLRKEAIKHVKKLEEYKSIAKPEMTVLMMKCIDEKHIPEQAIADWIKHFFNITDEELNEVE